MSTSGEVTRAQASAGGCLAESTSLAETSTSSSSCRHEFALSEGQKNQEQDAESGSLESRPPEKLLATAGPPPVRAGNRNVEERCSLLVQKIEKLEHEIKTLDEADCDLESLESEDSIYLAQDRLKRELVIAWQKYCRLLGQSSDIQPERPRRFILNSPSLTDERINRRFLKYAESAEFPCMEEMQHLLRKCLRHYKLDWSKDQQKMYVSEAFKSLGNQSQKHRQKTFWDDNGSHLTDRIVTHIKSRGRAATSAAECNLEVQPEPMFDDPAKGNAELEAKLRQNQREAVEKMSAVFQTFADRPPEEQAADGSSENDDDDGDDDDGDDDDGVGATPTDATDAADSETDAGPDHTPATVSCGDTDLVTGTDSALNSSDDDNDVVLHHFSASANGPAPVYTAPPSSSASHAASSVSVAAASNGGLGGHGTSMASMASDAEDPDWAEESDPNHDALFDSDSEDAMPLIFSQSPGSPDQSDQNPVVDTVGNPPSLVQTKRTHGEDTGIPAKRTPLGTTSASSSLAAQVTGDLSSVGIAPSDLQSKPMSASLGKSNAAGVTSPPKQEVECIVLDSD